MDNSTKEADMKDQEGFWMLLCTATSREASHPMEFSIQSVWRHFREEPFYLLTDGGEQTLAKRAPQGLETRRNHGSPIGIS